MAATEISDPSADRISVEIHLKLSTRLPPDVVTALEHLGEVLSAEIGTDNPPFQLVVLTLNPEADEEHAVRAIHRRFMEWLARAEIASGETAGVVLNISISR